MSAARDGMTDHRQQVHNALRRKQTNSTGSSPGTMGARGIRLGPLPEHRVELCDGTLRVPDQPLHQRAERRGIQNVIRKPI